MKTLVKPWAIELTERCCGKSPLKIGDRVIHKRHGLVEITGGQYWGTYGLSNFWHWRKVLSDGTLDKKCYSGYGLESEFNFGIVVKNR